MDKVFRSRGDELSEGATDGKYKKVITDRGGFIDEDTYLARRDLAPVWYGVNEAPIKLEPGSNRPVRTPNYVPWPQPVPPVV